MESSTHVDFYITSLTGFKPDDVKNHGQCYRDSVELSIS